MEIFLVLGWILLFTLHCLTVFFLVYLYLDLTLLIQGLNQVCILLDTVIKDGIQCG